MSKIKFLIILIFSKQAQPLALLSSIADHPIMPVDEVKKLGVILDSSLFFHIHV